MVVQDAVNIEVLGSSPSEAVVCDIYCLLTQVHLILEFLLSLSF
jgi:hypothetical protein